MQLLNVVALLTTSFTLVLSANARGDFSRSCSNYYIDSDHYLRATCGNGQGGTTNSALDLNACIGISPSYAGNLDCVPNGNYAAQGCNSCQIRTGAYMICHCPGSDRVADLDACVANNHGLLTCAS